MTADRSQFSTSHCLAESYSWLKTSICQHRHGRAIGNGGASIKNNCKTEEYVRRRDYIRCGVDRNLALKETARFAFYLRKHRRLPLLSFLHAISLHELPLFFDQGTQILEILYQLVNTPCKTPISAGPRISGVNPPPPHTPRSRPAIPRKTQVGAQWAQWS